MQSGINSSDNSKGDKVVEQDPIDDVSWINLLGDPRKQLLVASGVFPFDNPCWSQ